MSLFASRSTLAAALSLALCSAPIAVYAHAAHVFNLPAQSLADSLRAVGSKAGVNVAFDPSAVRGKKAKALKGSFTVQQALQQLTEGAGLIVRTTDGGTFLIEEVRLQASIGNGLQEERAATPQSDQTATEAPAVDEEGSARQESRGRPGATASRAGGNVSEMDAVVVTGTRIRGGATASPLVTIDAAQIKEEGFTDLGEVIRSLPQNFSGGQNPGVASGAIVGNTANANVTGGSSLNLRGLGPDASLTLLNGRRMSYGGIRQAVDIDAIPVEAVERIDIVPDGASAIYGSDAVGGVANVILKREFEGVAVGVRYGNATDGGLTTREYTGTAGAVWSSGGLIATYKNSSADPIYADQRDYTEIMDDPTTLYPGMDLRSGLLSVHQSLGQAVELRLDALRTEREQYQHQAYPTSTFQYTPETTTSLVSPGIEFLLPNDWTLSLGGAWGKDKSVYNTSMVNLATGISTLSSNGCYCNQSRTYEASAEGPLFPLGDGDARLAVGAGYRTNDFSVRNYVTGTTGNDGDERSRFAYAEMNLPLIGPGSNVAGAKRLVLTAAVRSEDYDSFGMVTTPKLGLIYGPSADFTLKASWGKSYKAPTLYQQYGTVVAQVWPANWFPSDIGYAPDATVLMTEGGNKNLDAERARTWAASLAFHPEALPGLEAELTWFDIDYTDRVVQPVGNVGQALTNSIYSEFVDFSPTAEQQAEIIAAATVILDQSAAGYDADDVVAIIRNKYTNAARQRVKGIDLSGSYGLDLVGGRLTIRGSASWLDSSQQTVASQSEFDLSGTLFNPAEINGRIGAVWSQGGFRASAFANHVRGVTSNLLAGTIEKTASFTTLDATLRYGIEERGDVWSGLEFALSAQNMFDRAPPSYTVTAPTSMPYDSTNYSAIGRFLSVSVSKRW